MEVILLQKIENLGGLGDIVNVRPGYARNFLVPAGKAKMATKINIQEFEHRRAELEKAAQDATEAAQSRAEQLQDMVFTIKANAGTEGKLYGSVSSIEIAEVINAAGIPIERREIRLPDDGSLRQLGEYEIGLHLHSDVDVQVKVIVEEDDE